jgi:hypothetical protein
VDEVPVLGLRPKLAKIAKLTVDFGDRLQGTMAMVGLVTNHSAFKAEWSLFVDKKYALVKRLHIACNLFGMKPPKYLDHVSPPLQLSQALPS